VKRRVYLEMKTLEEAKEIFVGRFGSRTRTGVEEVLAEDSLGRVTAGPIFAKISSPTYHSAAMDGIVVRAEDTFGATEKKPKILITGQDAVWINTGQALPEGFNSVIMVEKVHSRDQEHLEIRSAAYPWQNIRKVGEDIVATQLLLPQDHKIRPYDIGALISSGIFKLPVWKKPKVVIIPTGSELVSYKEVRDPGRLEKNQIMEYNSLMLAALVRECAAIPVIDRIVQDREEDIRGALMRALEADADLIIINAGSSAGSKDYDARQTHHSRRCERKARHREPGVPGFLHPFLPAICRPSSPDSPGSEAYKAENHSRFSFKGYSLQAGD
jgi:putative molybdopterin biosynthesis protein